MLRAPNKWIDKAVVIFIFFGQGVFAQPVTDKDKFPWVQPVPTIEELTGGKIKTGEKITKDNMQYVKDHMAAGMDLLTADGAEWIVAPHTPSEELIIPALIEATHKNAGKAVVKADGSVFAEDGSPWYGGFPVLNPKTGPEVMASWLYRDHDNYEQVGYSHWTSAEGEVYKVIVVHNRMVNTSGRVCVDPGQQDPRFPGELRREMLVFEAPYDLKGVSVLNIFYQDQSKLPDAYAYVPVLRRVQRLSTAQRDDSLDGSDLRNVNLNLFNDPISLWDFKLVAHKPMLSIISRDNPTNSEENKHIPRIKGKYREGAQVELRDTYVVEATPKEGAVDRIYSKMTLHIDAATYVTWWGSYYDSQGELWVSGIHSRKKADSPCGNYAKLTSVEYFNHQTKGSNNVDIIYQRKNMGKDVLDPTNINVQFLQQQGR